jgi:hypothetical protein
MAANDSPTSICNLALGMVGGEPILNVNPPDNSRRAVLCAQFYDPSRRAMLMGAPWKEAKRQAQLAASPTPPLFTWGQAYPLPADWLRMWDLPEDWDRGIWGYRWEVMNLTGIGRCIVTDAAAPLDLVYVFDLQDTTQMSADLVMAIAADLAASLAIPLARDIQLKQTAEAVREGRLSVARTTSAQQNSPRQWDADVLLRSRA